LYRHVWRRRPARLLEIGIGTGERARRLIAMARAMNPGQAVRYAGIDLFELRRPDDGSGMSLKLAHRSFVDSGAKVQLIPGDPRAALARSANALGVFDLVLVAADQDRQSLAGAWFYVPRMLAEGAAVFVEESRDGTPRWRRLSDAELRELSGGPTRRHAA
jgi:hypothetical protein